MSRILHVTNAFPTCKSPDYGIFIKEQVESLDNLVDTNHIYFINAREKGVSEYFKSIFRLRLVLKENKYDIVHCHHIFSFYVALLTFSLHRFKTVTSFLNQPENEIKLRIPSFLKEFMYLLVKKNSDRVILKNSLSSKQISDPKIIQLPNGVDTEKFHLIDSTYAKEKLGLNVNRNYILFVSSKNPDRKQKRRDLFLKMIDNLQFRHSNGKFYPLEISGVSRDEVIYYFNAACCHLLTSDYEGSPNSVKEALACGVPVVSRAVGNVEQMISGSEECYIFNEHKIDAAIDFIADNYPLPEKSRNNIQAILKEKKLDMGNIAVKLNKIYNEL